MSLSDDLLLEHLRSLRASVDTLQQGQTELHSAVTAVDTRVAGLEGSMKTLKRDVRKDARRWGAIGGAASSAVALLMALVKAVVFPGHTG